MERYTGGQKSCREHSVPTSQHVDVQKDFAHSGICTSIYTGSAITFLFILLHLNVPSTKFDKQVTVLPHLGETSLLQQCSDTALQCVYSHERCFNKLLY